MIARLSPILAALRWRLSCRVQGLVLAGLLAVSVQPAPAQDAGEGKGGLAQTVTGTPAPETPTPETPAADPATPPKAAQITVSKGTKSISVTPTESNAPDFRAWERLAARAEEAVANRGTDPETLTELRGLLADWRSAFLVAQNANSARIGTLRTQIGTLGPVPAEGETEAPELAERRKKLADQLVRLQAPGIEAEEAYSRADGLIKEIDRIERERQADELLRLWPAPVNPANWPDAAVALRDIALVYWNESRVRWQLKGPRENFFDNLPLILGLLVVALGLLWRGRSWVENRVERLQLHASVRGREVWALLASLGQIIIPTLGIVALVLALIATGMLGEKGAVFVTFLLPMLGVVVFFARWLGTRLFPQIEGARTPLRLGGGRRAEGRFLVLMAGLVIVADTALELLIEDAGATEAAQSVLRTPFLIAGAVILFRLGQLLRRNLNEDRGTGEPVGYRDRMIGFAGRAAMIIGVVGPVLALVGYVSAAEALIFPALGSLGFLGILFVLQQLIQDLYVLITRDEEGAHQALVPTLAGFVLTLMTLPAFALIWGARWADLTELWTRFREGFQMGSTRISPTDFLYFAIVFAVGYMLTRLFQGALKTSILPKTRMDQGGQNAISSGVGYLGIFLSALIAINAAGIDLSGLAIVAGALSLGIGFGLQNIVSNFVSGIILLIERPVSEGDWIEVGGVQGTVRSISVRSTRIQTFDRSDVIVPNSDLVSGRVTNMTRFNLTGRLIVPVGVDYGSDTRKVAQVLQEIAEAQPMVVLEPPPVVAFMGLGADALNFEIRVILRDVNFSLATRTEINHQIVQRFHQEGISMPFSQRDLWFRNPEDLARALAAVNGPAGGAPVAAAPAGGKRGKAAPPPALPPQPTPSVLQDPEDGTGEPWARPAADDDGETR